MSVCERILRLLIGCTAVFLVSFGSIEALHNDAWVVATAAGGITVGVLSSLPPLSRVRQP